ncbi:hypothetical protein B0A48_04034 [Cryoendolithus antarcticus]|uniref:N-acetyltransferase domain-containing protein n=1 Tax=Cryoendolithus antarcticus TaxID=1507870 RepID=A0A1V8THH8_9PEZI|nr:hypothetical protein B0A48_04034 [Cryoendolithus antarcticus]
MANFTIRPRRSEDLDACLEVLQKVYKDSGYPVNGPSLPFLQGPQTLSTWVATTEPPISSGSPTDHRMLGHIALATATDTDVAVHLWRSQNRPEPVFVLQRLFVDPEAQGQGIAQDLIKAVVDEGRSRGGSVVLFALIKDQGAMRLYERLGWTEFGRAVFGEGKGQGVEMEAVCYLAPTE